MHRWMWIHFGMMTPRAGVCPRPTAEFSVLPEIAPNTLTDLHALDQSDGPRNGIFRRQ